MSKQISARSSLIFTLSLVTALVVFNILLILSFGLSKIADVLSISNTFQILIMIIGAILSLAGGVISFTKVKERLSKQIDE